MTIDRMIEARARDLEGVEVARVLPSRGRRFVGPFVFLDHMLPGDHEHLVVRPHPHINLGTVTYLFEGAIDHRDSLGSHQLIQPGAINWMSAGRGIVHSERSPARARHHGIQLWVGLPKAHEETAPSFTHYPAEALPVLADPGRSARVLIGDALGATSPVATVWPMFYVDVELEAGARVEVPDGYVERAAYVISGGVTAGGVGTAIPPRTMAVFVPGAKVVLEAQAPARVILLGGEPLDGPRYIWWNFVSSDRERIVQATRDWREGRFPKVPGDELEFTPAPDGDPKLAPQ